uniref:Transposable element Hobo transposase n=1 Tax=Zeugodacus cucurbitae TaxID=28588 RepID=A0A0A1WJC0_ZEUCU
MTNFFIKLGAVYGENIDVDDHLPDPTTVSRNVQKSVEKTKLEIRGEIAEAGIRWNSHYRMLKAIHDNWADMNRILSNKGRKSTTFKDKFNYCKIFGRCMREC